jgi:Xaa-Pro aminopeptidase
MSRITRLAERLSRPLLVTRPANIRYLTGMGDSSNAAVLVEPDGQATFYTDFRYADAARALPEVTFVQTQRHVVGALASLLAGRELGADPEHLTFSRWEELRSGGVALVPTGGDVEALRAVKDASEVDAIRRAAAISDVVFGELATDRFVGRTERELVWQIDRRFRELGAERSSFDTMVGFGEMGARPHGEARDEKIPTGTMVVVDGGCVVDGYCSDCTRTFLTGDDPRLRELYGVCLQAQLDGLAAVRAGVTGRDADAASRVAIEAAGLGERFGHGLGHGVGLEIHEAPSLRPESTDTLVAGNVVTVEPGIYLDGDVGVRIEDLVLVTEDGCERLTTATKDPIVVG